MTHQLSSMFSLPPRQPDVPASAETDTCRRRIQKLPRKTQQVFLLSRLDQLPYTAIAQLLELDIDSVERKIVRVLVHCSHSADETAEKALRWYAHLQSPLATASQRIEFRHWLDADSRHLNAFQDAERLWRSLEAPAALMGASGWYRRKRRVYIGWLMLTAFLCSLLVTAEAFT
ncbi:DUF4880 domain-containing protein [Pseudomonas sp. SLFW]|uniref:DUF4880 domain-containing protein n=1 Tax=Pseudomonas sp. SLFW TaxID=2683259 RepID=UPI0014120FA7|nr:DUF4880 domain-containing protein [Pseudomonas sp. SLFW]NBB09426.1 DUF4880 domain-containing protein [Pseudomonas sp. SLFW]